MNQTNTKSTQWSIRYAGATGFGFEKPDPSMFTKLVRLLRPTPSAETAFFILKNRAANPEEVRTLIFSGGGLAAGLKIRATMNLNPNWIDFETEQPYSFSDFIGPARIGSFNVSIGIGYSVGFVTFSNIDIKQAWWKGEEINISGPIGGTSISLGYHPLGTVTIPSLNDEMADTTSQLAPETTTQEYISGMNEKESPIDIDSSTNDNNSDVIWTDTVEIDASQPGIAIDTDCDGFPDQTRPADVYTEPNDGLNPSSCTNQAEADLLNGYQDAQEEPPISDIGPDTDID